MNAEELRSHAAWLNPREVQPPVVVVKSSMEWMNEINGIESLNKDIMGTHGYREIDRKKVFSLKKSDRYFVPYVLYWGFSTKNYGPVKPVLVQIDALRRIHRALKEESVMTETEFLTFADTYFRNTCKVGIAYFSKMLYFLEERISYTNNDGQEKQATCVIYDSLVRKAIQHLQGDELAELRATEGVRDDYARYLAYVKAINNLAEGWNLNPDRLEYVLWIQGKMQE